MLKIGFFGTPYLAKRVLEDLYNTPEFEITFVITNPPKPVGRSNELKSTPVEDFALEKNIPIFTPTKIRENRDFFDQLRSFECDYFVVVAYGRILPLELLEIPKHFSLNVHGSILPKYRGASPIQSALLHGEKETGVTIMKMSEGMDEGDILKIRRIPLDEDETSESLFLKFAEISGPALIATLRELEMGGITPLPQDHKEATYCKKIEKEDGLIDWTKSAEEIYHMWQAYTPWPGIYTMYDGKRLILEKVMSDEGGVMSDEYPGIVVKGENGEIGVICGDGVLTLRQVKLEGKKSQNIKDFVNGNQDFISSML